LQEFKKGTSVMAIKSGVPVVPVACSGAHRVMEKRKLNIKPGNILVEFLEPIDPAKYSLDEREVLLQEIHDRLAAGLPPGQRPMGFTGAA
jgi:1-acyl-sn-glycerol-3-phosphate acyltransferase